jgi:hypothetical protein
MGSVLTLQEVQEIAFLKGGKCLSSAYKNTSTSLKWQCRKGHTWDAPYSIISKGAWCSRCKKDEEKVARLERIKKFVALKDGKCLSDVYVNSNTHLILKCKNNHTWKAKPSNILRGYWCAVCAGNAKLGIEFFQKIAEERGGKCLSKKYQSKEIKLKFQCAEDHVWKATPRNIKAGTWCPICAKPPSNEKFYKKQNEKIKLNYYKSQGINLNSHKTNIPGTIELMQLYAKARDGECLSKKYVNSGTKLKWRCAENHIWETLPEGIFAGNWCPYCAATVWTLNDMKKKARERGGKCLSGEYKNNNVKLLWQCAYNHQWEATPAHVLRDSWCPYCGDAVQNSLAAVKDFAKNKGGLCLSKNYSNRQSKLLWKCAEGHEWEATYSHVSRGSWCPECGKQKAQETKKEFYNAFNETP